MPSHEVTVLPDTIEDVAEFALAKVIEAGSGVAKNVMNFLRDLEEVKHILMVLSDFVMLHTSNSFCYPIGHFMPRTRGVLVMIQVHLVCNRNISTTTVVVHGCHPSIS